MESTQPQTQTNTQYPGPNQDQQNIPLPSQTANTMNVANIPSSPELNQNQTQNQIPELNQNQMQGSNNLSGMPSDEMMENNVMGNNFSNLNSESITNDNLSSNNTESKKTNIHRVYEYEFGERNKKCALLLVNVQNCFFRGGSFAMYPSNDVKDDVYKEKELIRSLNQLIGLFEEDVDYFNAGLSGSPVMAGGLIENEDDDSGMTLYEGSYATGTRKKYFFDHIIYTQTAYPPDHFSFASHHYLREKKKKIQDLIQESHFTYEEAVKKVKDDSLDKHFWSYVDSNFRNAGMNEFDGDTKLYPDHALIDGSDSVIENQVCYRGVDFHPRLNIGPLYRPNNSINQQVYIKAPEMDGRGRIMWLGADNKSAPRSAFMNSLKESTGLGEFLKEQGVEKIFVAGLFRDVMVESTLLDALESGFDDVTLIYDATLPYGAPSNDTKVNNRHYFKNQSALVQYLERIASEEDEENFLEYLHENNKWAQNLEKKNVKIINGSDILETIKVGKSEFSCGFNPDSIIKNFDIFLKTSTTTSRLEDIIQK